MRRILSTRSHRVHGRNAGGAVRLSTIAIDHGIADREIDPALITVRRRGGERLDVAHDHITSGEVSHAGSIMTVIGEGSRGHGGMFRRDHRGLGMRFVSYTTGRTLRYGVSSRDGLMDHASVSTG